MKITEPCGKEREILSLKKVSFSHKDTEGNSITEDYVEVIIKGQNRDWKNWYLLREFREHNPTLKV